VEKRTGTFDDPEDFWGDLRSRSNIGETRNFIQGGDRQSRTRTTVKTTMKTLNSLGVSRKDKASMREEEV